MRLFTEHINFIKQLVTGLSNNTFMHNVALSMLMQRSLPDSLYVRLFPFNGCRRFAGDVIYDPVYPLYFVHDTAGDAFEGGMWQPGPISGHKVFGCDGT